VNLHTPTERAAFYHSACPDWPVPRTDDRWLDGIWVQGNNYQGTGYWGAYPPTYLKRITGLFPDAQRVLHLFSGSLPRGPYTRFDRREGADVVGEAEQLASYFPDRRPDGSVFDLVLADPPYSTADALKYGAPALVNRRKVFEGVHEILEPGGVLVWLDLILPMFAKTHWHLWGLIGLVGSTNHKVRLVSMFTRL
jgi:hypothetical protein